MAKDKYTEAQVRSKLEKKGCRISGNTIMVHRGRLGINALGMVDYLVKQCKMVVKYE